MVDENLLLVWREFFQLEVPRLELGTVFFALEVEEDHGANKRYEVQGEEDEVVDNVRRLDFLEGGRDLATGYLEDVAA